MIAGFFGGVAGIMAALVLSVMAVDFGSDERGGHKPETQNAESREDSLDGCGRGISFECDLGERVGNGMLREKALSGIIQALNFFWGVAWRHLKYGDK